MSGERVDIMLVVSDMGGGGAQRVLCAVASHWVAAGHKVAVTTLSEPGNDFFRLPDAVTRTSIGLNSASQSLLTGLINNACRVWRLRRLLKRMQPAVAVGFVGPTAVLLVAAAVGTGVRVVAAERNDPARQSFGPIWDRLCRAAYRYADLVTANSPGAVEALGRFVPAGRLLFTPNPIPAATAGPRASLQGPAILAVGRLHRQKGIDILLNAFARVQSNEWRLVLVGEGSDREKLEAQAQALGIASRVHFEGVATDPAPYYRAADIFVLPSRHEGTPNALMEAMAFGLPVVVSDGSPGPLNLVEDGISGLITPVEDAPALAKALERLMADAGLRARLGAGARDAMKARRERDEALALWDRAIGFSAGGATR
ncbi:MAG: glycosyltransferase family 4 protein [Deltaproteobacteria bacterium]|nr:glycosyltransferase family 4 protein [Deltaproteobacteria bacterium]